MEGDLAPWLALAGLGAFHGLNPAMGWLFAVALALHRGSRRVLWVSLLPIAAGHALSVAAVALAVVWAGLIVDTRWIEIGAAALLITVAVWHWVKGHSRPVRVGMTVGMGGLGLWSFAMATMHGAGLMLIPVLIPLCLAAGPGAELTASGSLPIALGAIGVHMGAMLAVTFVIATVVYEVFGVAFLRRGWINLDLIWSGALIIAALALLFI